MTLKFVLIWPLRIIAVTQFVYAIWSFIETTRMIVGFIGNTPNFDFGSVAFPIMMEYEKTGVALALALILLAVSVILSEKSEIEPEPETEPTLTDEEAWNNILGSEQPEASEENSNNDKKEDAKEESKENETPPA